MKWYMLFFYTFFLVTTSIFAVDQFIVQNNNKKNRKETINVVRETCVEVMGNCIQLFPDIMHSLANSQQLLFSQLTAFFEDDKTCYLLVNSKDILQKAKEKLLVCEKKISSISNELKELDQILHSLKLIK